MKDFTIAFDILLDKLKKRENFAFTRFSDGELFIMQNKKVVLAESTYVTGDIEGFNRYTIEEQKEFIPKRDEKYRQKLIECYMHNQDNFFKGICTGTDPHVGDENFKYMIDLHGGDHPNLTFSNLLINANYKRFMEEMVPIIADLADEYDNILYVVNENANTRRLPFKLKKEFHIGSNCMIDSYHVIEEVREYIKENNIENHIVLCSAASLSNFITYENFKDNNNNTYLDIGSCLNPVVGLEGWVYTRGYLTSYWLNEESPFGSQVDIWQNTD